MKLSDHHIIYDWPGEENFDDDVCPHCNQLRQREWMVALPWSFHKPMIIIQRWKPTHERYALLTNWVHAILYEWNNMRRRLDQMEE